MVNCDMFDLVNTPDNFSAGKTRLCKEKWKELTTDPWILSSVMGVSIDFIDCPQPPFVPRPILYNQEEFIKINTEIQSMLFKGIIETCGHSDGEYVSNIFSRI